MESDAPRHPTTLAHLLREARLRLGLTQAALADRAGLSIRTIEHLESGRGQPFAHSALQLADGPITATDALALKWKKAPPYLVFNSACESGRAAGGRRLVSGANRASGLVAAFLASGVFAYCGFFWPVSDAGAGLFTRAFYETLFRRENVGLAFLEARRYVSREFGYVGDLTGHGAILFGDAASKHRRDLVTAR